MNRCRACLLGVALLAWGVEAPAQEESQETSACRQLFSQVVPFGDELTVDQFHGQKILAQLVSYQQYAEQAAIEVLSREDHWSRHAVALYVLGEIRSSRIFVYLDRPLDSRAKVFALQGAIKQIEGTEGGMARGKQLETLVGSDETLMRLSRIGETNARLDSKQLEDRLRRTLQQQQDEISSGQTDLSGSSQIIIHDVGLRGVDTLLMAYDGWGAPLRDQLMRLLASMVNVYEGAIDQVAKERILATAIRASTDQDASIRRSALDVLWEYWKQGDSRVESDIRRLAEDPDQSVSWWAEHCVTAIAEEKARRSANHSESGTVKRADSTANPPDVTQSRTTVSSVSPEREKSKRAEDQNSGRFGVIAAFGAIVVAVVILSIWQLRRQRRAQI